MADTIVQNETFNLIPLRRAMRANGIFSGASGILFLAASAPVARFIGVAPPAIVAGIGAALVGYAGLLFWSTGIPQMNRRWGMAAIGMDLLWVLGSILLLLTGWVPFTTAGQWVVGLLAEVVFWFAVWQGYALWRERKG